MRNFLCLLGLLLALLSALPASAITLFVSPNGDGAFIIEGDNINDAESIEITVTYDTSILANPRVSLQGGTVTNIFDGIPGTLTFYAYLGENRAASFEAHLTFDKKGDAPGGIISVSGTARGAGGNDSPAGSSLNLFAPPSATPPVIEPAAAGAGEISRDSEAPDAGAASSKKELAAGQEKDATSDRVAQKSAANTEAPVAPGDAVFPPLKSPLQRFKEYKGRKGLKELAALLEQRDGNGMAQEPAIALSDGKTPVTLKLELPAEGSHAPNFALLNANLVSLRKANEKRWIITVLPSIGTWKASLILSTDSKKIEFPLVVAPLVEIQKGIDDKNFPVSLNKYLSLCQAKSNPLSGYVNEYIFTANYLVRGKKVTKDGGENKYIDRGNRR